jgi:hypothetical protein
VGSLRRRQTCRRRVTVDADSEPGSKSFHPCETIEGTPTLNSFIVTNIKGRHPASESGMGAKRWESRVRITLVRFIIANVFRSPPSSFIADFLALSLILACSIMGCTPGLGTRSLPPISPPPSPACPFSQASPPSPTRPHAEPRASLLSVAHQASDLRHESRGLRQRLERVQVLPKPLPPRPSERFLGLYGQCTQKLPYAYRHNRDGQSRPGPLLRLQSTRSLLGVRTARHPALHATYTDPPTVVLRGVRAMHSSLLPAGLLATKDQGETQLHDTP